MLEKYIKMKRQNIIRTEKSNKYNMEKLGSFLTFLNCSEFNRNIDIFSRMSLRKSTCDYEKNTRQSHIYPTSVI